jgi:hypothetical protein
MPGEYPSHIHRPLGTMIHVADGFVCYGGLLYQSHGLCVVAYPVEVKTMTGRENLQSLLGFVG